MTTPPPCRNLQRRYQDLPRTRPLPPLSPLSPQIFNATNFTCLNSALVASTRLWGAGLSSAPVPRTLLYTKVDTPASIKAPTPTATPTITPGELESWPGGGGGGRGDGG